MSKGERAQANAALLEKPTPRDQPRILAPIEMVLTIHSLTAVWPEPATAALHRAGNKPMLCQKFRGKGKGKSGRGKAKGEKAESD